MKSTIAACLLAFSAMAGAEESDEGSIPAPTELSILATNATNDIVVSDNPRLIESEDSSVRFTVVEVLAGDVKKARGVRLSLQNASRDDSVYLDANQMAQLRDEFVGLDRWYQRNQTCEAQKRCVQGIARCRPSQPIRQAICPGFYSTPNGARGVLVSTLRDSFLFPSVGPSEFAIMTSSLAHTLAGTRD